MEDAVLFRHEITDMNPGVANSFIESKLALHHKLARVPSLDSWRCHGMIVVLAIMNRRIGPRN